MSASISCDLALPTCTSESLALTNLGVQITRWGADYARVSRPADAVALIDGLLNRHSVRADHTDLRLAESTARDFLARAPDDPDAWIASAILDTTLHRFSAAEDALARAERLGARASSLAEPRADMLEARGDAFNALALRLDLPTDASPADRLSRIACCQVALGDPEGAEASFASAVRSYRGPSPFALAAMLFNWGHAWQHRADYGRASEAFGFVLGYLPGHVRAWRSLAASALACGEGQRALDAAGQAVELNPEDPISVGTLGLIRRHTGCGGHRPLLARAHLIFRARMAEHPEAWAGHAAEFWAAEGEHPAQAAQAAALASVRHR